MGNICDAMGIARKPPVDGPHIGHGNEMVVSSDVDGNKNDEDEDEDHGTTTSPVVSSASNPKHVYNLASANTKNTKEIKVAFAKKQSQEAAAAAAVEVLTGPRIRLMPHQHSLFCERKVGEALPLCEQQFPNIIVISFFLLYVFLIGWFLA
jgi:hypothetical protein